MADQLDLMTTFYSGWGEYQQYLVDAVAPLTSAQLALRAAPDLRTVEELVAHINGARARWFQGVLGAVGDPLSDISSWDRPNQPTHTASEMVQGLRTTWQAIETTLASLTPTDLPHVYEGTFRGEPYKFTRGWVIWHVIEHDIHHGGELFFSLGMHGLPVPDL